MKYGHAIVLDLQIQTFKTLRMRFRRVRPHENVDEVLFQHDNAQPYTFLKTQDAVTKLGWKVLPQPPYNFGLALTDFSLFWGIQRCHPCEKD
jgi:hypothetical protein